MSKAVEETLRKLERTHIGEASAGSSPSSTVSGSLPTQSTEAPAAKEPLSAASTATATSLPASEASAANGETGVRRSRRAVQSMYGAPPGYNATMGVGGGRDTTGRGRVASSRQRNSIMVPDQLQAAMHPQNIAPMASLQAPAMRLTGAEFALMANMPEDAIPNAIVVKNINFAIKREELLQTMADRGLPLPYAFNYHFDGTMFRGLAFGNFRTPEEAARVIVGLNGVTLLGRPLKVEYKKTLPGTAPPPHPNTIAMMTSSSHSMASSDGQSDYASQQQRHDQPIPRSRRGQNGEAMERPRSMMVLPSAMSVPEPGSHNTGQQQTSDAASGNNGGDMIDLDDPDTRSVYDLISGFRHNKSMGELEFPSGLNTRQRQIVMLVAERFGLNHETKSDTNGRTIRVYKGIDTLLEGAEVRRRSMASPSASSMSGGRYSAGGRSRPSSMLYPETMSMSGLTSPPPQRMNLYQQQQQQQHMYHQNHDPSRVRSYTHSQGASQLNQQFQGMHHHQQQFSRDGMNSGRTSGNYVGYPSRLYQDSVVVPARQPRGPDMSQNFAARQQMHQQDERQAQRQAQLKVLQQNRQRRLSSANEEASAALESSFKITKPVNKAIPIVKPREDEPEAGSSSSSPSSPASDKNHQQTPATEN
ncbi:Peptidyl-prolyl cis-trans isomerase pin4 [Coemansia brasiliensis]|uniref:Peptidyl-prolyl cis-trans isomerase pin4 n=1 Tax=Coemansia brasiliensis TaxID=2650707 RepID=A0A9W8ICW0_9FUNG|nr:Peptidyl-prolyl cis-trans isomerase pin4 [Coemansia brasiliensis]